MQTILNIVKTRCAFTPSHSRTGYQKMLQPAQQQTSTHNCNTELNQARQHHHTDSHVKITMLIDTVQIR